jgi:flagellar assembly factor FliW
MIKTKSSKTRYLPDFTFDGNPLESTNISYLERIIKTSENRSHIALTILVPFGIVPGSERLIPYDTEEKLKISLSGDTMVVNSYELNKIKERYAQLTKGTL